MRTRATMFTTSPNSSSPSPSSAVRKTDLARRRRGAASYEAGDAARVMRGAKRPYTREAWLRIAAGHRMYECRLEALRGSQRRQQAAEGAGKHRLAGTGRPDEQQIVSAC